MWSALATIILGAIGWAGAKLLFEPIKEIVDRRREAQESLLIFGNLSKDAPSDERHLAAGTFRRIGAGLVSRHIAAWPWVAWFCDRCLLWDTYSAGTMLIGIGNSTLNDGFSHANASPTVPLIRSCLRLPVLGDPTMIREMMENAGRPAPLETGRHF
jgi:hypothetical protein